MEPFVFTNLSTSVKWTLGDFFDFQVTEPTATVVTFAPGVIRLTAPRFLARPGTVQNTTRRTVGEPLAVFSLPAAAESLHCPKGVTMQ